MTVLVAYNDKYMVDKAGLKSISYWFSKEADPHEGLSHKVEGLFTGEGHFSNIFIGVRRAVNRLCPELMEKTDLMEKIREGEFDLTLNDNVPFMMCLFVIPYKFNIPHISLGMWNDPWLAGVSASPTHEALPILPARGRMTFIEKVLSVISYVFLSNFQSTFSAPNDIVRRYAPYRPPKTIRQIIAESEMWLMTSDVSCFDFPKVSAPNYRFIGSLTGSVAPKPLPKNLEEFVSSSPSGVIVVSFGSVETWRRALRPVIHKLLDALGRMQEKTILQFAPSELEGIHIPNDILLQEWLPQNDLLGHNKTKLFIGHGGLNGQLEATYNGIPMITLPYQPEQVGNGARAEAKKHGKLYDWQTVTSEQLYGGMKELIENPEYKQNVKRCAEIINDLPDAKKELVFWVNHILKFGGAHLRPPAADMGVIEFFMIDVIAFFFSVFCIIAVVLFLCLRCVCKLCCRNRKEKSE